MPTDPDSPRRIGRYLLFGPLASGGMATVHLGRLVGDAGFSRMVAIKRLHPQLLDAPEIAASLLDEARIVCRIQHPNVVPTLDLLLVDGEAFLVMEYVRGESLARLLAAARKRGEAPPVRVVAAILTGVLHGLHAAHEARSESGEPLGIVHRDVSPDNVLTGADGVGRLLDFGIARAEGRLSTTRSGQLKGKLAYMAPEQILCGEVTRRTDVYAAGIVLWEALAGRRLFQGADEHAVLSAALEAPIPPPSEIAAGAPAALDPVVLRALSRNAALRYPTARDLAIAVEGAIATATPREVGEWVERIGGEELAARAARVARLERLPLPAAPAEVPPGRRAAVAAAEARRPSSPPPPGLETLPDIVLPPPLDTVDRPGAELAPPEAVRPSRRRIVAAAIAGSLLLGIAGLLARGAAPRTPSTGDTSPPPAPAASPPSVEPQGPSSAEGAAAPPSRPAEPPASAGAPRPAPPPHKAHGADARRCSPPYTVDSTGLRHLKPECI